MYREVGTQSVCFVLDWKGIVGCHQLTPHCTVVTAIRESELMCEAQLGEVCCRVL